MTGQDWIEKDFYAALGVPKDADAAAIKKAYRKLARAYHPDQNPGDEQAEARFKEVGEAYAVLSDAEQRQQYDSLRAMAGGGPRFASGPGGTAGGFEDLFGGMFSGAEPGGSRMRYATDAGGVPLDDILGGLFGGGGGQPAGFGAQRGADLGASTRLSFRAAMEGAQVTLTLSGGRSFQARIPAGVHDGQKIRLRGKGQSGTGGAPAGDLVVTVSVDAHPVFGVDGRNLTIDVPITFPEAVHGVTISVPTLTGDQVRVKVPAGTQSGTRLRVKARGVKSAKGTGDLIVTVNVAVPRNLSKSATEALEQFDIASDGTDPRAGLVEAAQA